MEYLSKITPVGSDVTYFLLTNLTEDPVEIGISLTDGKSAWKGQVTQGDFWSQSAKSGIPEDDVRDGSVKALTRKDMGSLVFEYQTKTAGSKMNLVWKKVVAAEDIKFQLGNVTLKESEDSHSTICKIIEFSLKSVNELSSKITNLKAENERLTNERANALKRLEKCVAAKESMEVDLYSKFVVVVNDKKARIRKLNDKVKDLQNGVPSSSAIYRADDEKPKRRKVESSDESEVSAPPSDYETDDDKPSTSSSSTQPKKTKPKPKISEDADDSLMLDDGTEEAESAVVRRKRRQSSLKKQTPAKPVIPKVSSTTPDVRSSTSRKSSARKRSTAASNRSSHDVDADDLLDELT